VASARGLLRTGDTRVVSARAHDNGFAVGETVWFRGRRGRLVGYRRGKPIVMLEGGDPSVVMLAKLARTRRKSLELALRA
jgi:hypothetical protein